MSKTIRYLFIFGVFCCVLLYGLLAGHYRLFPFEQLMGLRNNTLFNTLKTEALRMSGNQQATPGQTLNTALERLFVKEVPLDLNPAFGAHFIDVEGDLLYLVSHTGAFYLYDIRSFRKVDTAIEPLPMNADHAAGSGVISIPNFSVNGFRVLGLYVEQAKDGRHVIYVTHHRYEKDRECVSVNLSRNTLTLSSEFSSIKSGSWETLFSATPCIQPNTSDDGSRYFQVRLSSGGHIYPYDEQHLLVATGDFGYDGMIHENLADDPDNYFGKILLVNKQSGQYSIFAEGMRNTQGMYRDQQQMLWATDQGPQGGDEINILEQGNHYGWPKVTYGVEYDNQPWPHSTEQGRHDMFDKPRFAWPNAVAPTEILRIENQDKFTPWAGDLLVATLRDQSLHRLRVEDQNHILYDERIELGHRIRDMAFLPNGSLALITDGMILIIIEDGGPVYEQPAPDIKKRLAAMENYNRFSAAK